VAEQSARGVVGVTVGWPVVQYGEEAHYPLSDVTVETVCLRVGQTNKDDAGGTGDADRKDGARRHRVDLRR
jgi:hypothetical protein